MKSGNRNLILVIAGVVIVALVVLVLVILSDDDAGARWEKNPDITRTEEPGITKPGEEGALNIPANDPVERLNRFKEWAQYPPYSRPLTEGNVDLIDPYNAEKAPLGVIAKPGKGCKNRPEGGVVCEQDPVFSSIKCKVTPETSILVGQKDIDTTVYCVNEKGQKLELKNMSAYMERLLNRTRTRSLPPLHIGDDGENGDKKAGDRIYTVRFRTGPKDWGQMRVTVEFEVDGLKHSQTGDFWSTPHKVAEFAKSGIRDAVENGSLYVYVPVTIIKPGYYEFQANLQEAEGDKRFIAHSTVRQEFKAGATNIRFEFFGKLLRDANIDGPYIVREIRGKRHNSPVSKAEVEKSRREGTTIERETTEPLWEHVAPYEGTFTTQPYEVSQFSNKEYDSPEKQRRIKFYKSLIP